MLHGIANGVQICTSHKSLLLSQLLLVQLLLLSHVRTAAKQHSTKPTAALDHVDSSSATHKWELQWARTWVAQACGKLTAVHSLYPLTLDSVARMSKLKATVRQSRRQSSIAVQAVKATTSTSFQRFSSPSVSHNLRVLLQLPSASTKRHMIAMCVDHTI